MGETTRNTVTLRNGTFYAHVQGGSSHEGGVFDNAADISDAMVSGDIYGGESDLGLVSGNTVRLQNSTANGNVYGGYVKEGSAENNEVRITDSTVGWDVYGGWVNTGAASGNILSIENSFIRGHVTGAETAKGNAENNQVTITGSAVSTDFELHGDLTGAAAADGIAGNNTLTVTGSAMSNKVIRSVTGGYGANGAIGNRVSISDTEAGDGVIVTGGQANTGDALQNRVDIVRTAAGTATGGWTSAGNADGNTVQITQGEADTVTGGQTKTGTASDNRVDIEDSTIQETICGGKSDLGTVSGNAVQLQNSTANGNVYGGYVREGSAEGNAVQITNSTVHGEIAGGYVQSKGDADSNQVSITGSAMDVGFSVLGFYGAHTLDGAVTNNTLSVIRSSIQGDVVISGLFGGLGTTGAEGNRVYLEEAALEDGQIVTGGKTDTGDALQNRVDIVRTAAGTVTGGGTNAGNADGNIVYLKQGSAQNVIGGYVKSGYAENNSVYVVNSTVGGSLRSDVLGGHVTKDGAAQNNSVYISNSDVHRATGGEAIYGDAAYNQLAISESKSSSLFGGVAVSKGDAHDNQVMVTDSDVGDGEYGIGIWGGLQDGVGGVSYGNRVGVLRSAVRGSVYGGQSGYDSYDNHVRIEESQIEKSWTEEDGYEEGDIYGGKSFLREARQNTVFISQSTVGGSVYGGWAVKGTASGNEVQISGSQIGGSVYGGKSDYGHADENTVFISQSTVSGDVVGGSGSEAQGNQVVLLESDIDGQVFGGWAVRGTSSGNEVQIEKSHVEQSVYGGISITASRGNQVILAENNVESEVYGGYTYGNDASGNRVHMNDSQGLSVFGGWAARGTASENEVQISSSQISGSVYGGCVGMGAAKRIAARNTVYIDQSHVLSKVYGGKVAKGADDAASRDALDNQVFITNSTVGSSVYGGRSEDGTASGNTVQISGSQIGDSVYGGKSDYGHADENTVFISQSAVVGTVYGGSGSEAQGNQVVLLESDVDGWVMGGMTESGAALALDNQVQIEKSHVKQMVYGGHSVTASRGNQVVLAESNAASGVYGGYTEGNDASGNKVRMNDSQSVGVYGGWAAKGTASDNEVQIGGSQIHSAVYGGWVESSTAEGTADKNRVYVTESDIENGLIGGRVSQGSASDNIVLLKQGSANYVAGGTVAKSGYAAGNTVYIDQSHVLSKVYGGRVTKDASGDALDNQVFIANSTVGGDVYGGYSGSGAASGNLISLDASKTGSVWGGFALQGAGAAEGNQVFLRESRAGDFVTGGYAADGAASSNRVQLEKSYAVEVEGGNSMSSSGAANENQVILHQSKVMMDVTGGSTLGGSEASGNAVYVSESEIGESDIPDIFIQGGVLYGGDDDSGIAADNQVSITRSTVYADVLGGVGRGIRSEDRDMKRNGVFIQESTVTGSVYGGKTPQGMAAENAVQIRNSTVEGAVYGGYTEKGSVKDNLVVIDSSTVETLIAGGWISSWFSDWGSDYVGDVSGNVVVIRDSTVGSLGWSSVHGGFGDDSGGENRLVNVSGNAVYVSGSTMNLQYMDGGTTYTGDASGNSLWIEGGSHISAEAMMGGWSVEGDATGNQVAIYDSTVEGIVLGGSTEDRHGSVRDNLVILGGADTDVSQAAIFGGTYSYWDGGDVFLPLTGGNNSLTVNGWQGDVKRLAGFDSIYLTDIRLSGDEADIRNTGGGAAIRITAGESGDLKDTRIITGYLYTDGGTELRKGDSLSLLSSTNGEDLGIRADNLVNEGSVAIGASGEGSGRLVMKDGKLVYEVTDVKASRGANALAGNRLAALSFLSRGGDLASLALHGIHETGEDGWQTFGSAAGSRIQPDTETQPTVRGWNTLVGIGKSRARTTWNLFYEHGTGRYSGDSEQGEPPLGGRGDIRYQGGGAAVRHDLSGSTYIEAGVRAGRLKDEAEDALYAHDGFHDYKMNSTYWGAFAGMGKTYMRSDGIAVGIYGKFIHTALAGDSFQAAGDTFRLDRTESNRLKVGARITMPKTNKWTGWWGVSYEYEFSASAGGMAGFYRMDKDSLRGSSVSGELGMTYQASASSPWTVDLGVEGSVGKKEGWSGRFSLAYGF